MKGPGDFWYEEPGYRADDTEERIDERAATLRAEWMQDGDKVAEAWDDMTEQLLGVDAACALIGNESGRTARALRLLDIIEGKVVDALQAVARDEAQRELDDLAEQSDHEPED